ncbi:hypothetical protein QBC35DRAFT_504089 [Podospora australis]|uniref:Geranylgeranyl pyrophosphate synthetase n=1 Tax=Podospora australis TaxID=1536484 RepID=A0AAN6WNL1_9PEZI|nr:hypothetical protein QBC35DRAFT_504089 [Podospora australis]
MASTATTTISRSSLTSPAGATAKITNFKHIASYTWWNETAPTISVPGSPPLWTPPTTAPELEPDSGTVYVDQNAARCPPFPLEPLFRAALAENPDFSLHNVDLVTDRGNIRKLLRFVQASSDDHFQILVEVIGDGDSTTALFTRVEPKTMETLQGFRGYGRNFEKAYTEQSAGMSGHYRIVGYNFGGLRCVVRHETDAYIRDAGVDALSDTLVNDLAGLSISEAEKTASELTVVRSGKKADVPTSSLLEIKTRAASRVLDMAEVLPQLWISQTPNLAVGYYSKGVFKDVKVQDMTADILWWEAASQGDLGRLAGLLINIIYAVRRSSDRQAVVEYTGGSSLRVVNGNGKPALPEDLYAKCKVIATEEKMETNRDVEKGKKSEEIAPLIPVDTPFASDIEYAIRKGPRQFFCRLPGNLSNYRSLCEQLKSLSPEAVSKVLAQISFTYKDIMADFRRGKSDYDPDEGREIGGVKTLARDAAFRLVYMLLSGDARAEDRNAAYNATFFVVSHSRIFGSRTRKMVREAFEDRFYITVKQRTMMDRWIAEDADEGEDETTEEDVWHDSDSDYMYYGGISD